MFAGQPPSEKRSTDRHAEHTAASSPGSSTPSFSKVVAGRVVAFAHNAYIGHFVKEDLNDGNSKNGLPAELNMEFQQMKNLLRNAIVWSCGQNQLGSASGGHGGLNGIMPPQLANSSTEATELLFGLLKRKSSSSSTSSSVDRHPHGRMSSTEQQQAEEGNHSNSTIPAKYKIGFIGMDTATGRHVLRSIGIGDSMVDVCLGVEAFTLDNANLLTEANLDTIIVTNKNGATEITEVPRMVGTKTQGHRRHHHHHHHHHHCRRPYRYLSAEVEKMTVDGGEEMPLTTVATTAADEDARRVRSTWWTPSPRKLESRSAQRLATQLDPRAEVLLQKQLARGRGLVVGICPWGWEQTAKGADVRDCSIFNHLLRRCGMVFTPRYSEGQRFFCASPMRWSAVGWRSFSASSPSSSSISAGAPQSSPSSSSATHSSGPPVFYTRGGSGDGSRTTRSPPSSSSKSSAGGGLPVLFGSQEPAALCRNLKSLTLRPEPKSCILVLAHLASIVSDLPSEVLPSIMRALGSKMKKQQIPDTDRNTPSYSADSSRPLKVPPPDTNGISSKEESNDDEDDDKNGRNTESENGVTSSSSSCGDIVDQSAIVSRLVVSTLAKVFAKLSIDLPNIEDSISFPIAASANLTTPLENNFSNKETGNSATTTKKKKPSSSAAVNVSSPAVKTAVACVARSLLISAYTRWWRDLPVKEIRPAPGLATSPVPGLVPTAASTVERARVVLSTSSLDGGWQSCGLYVPPGKVCYVELTGIVDAVGRKVPSSAMTGLAIEVRVGCHTDKLPTAKPSDPKYELTRWPEITQTKKWRPCGIKETNRERKQGRHGKGDGDDPDKEVDSNDADGACDFKSSRSRRARLLAAAEGDRSDVPSESSLIAIASPFGGLLYFTIDEKTVQFKSATGNHTARKAPKIKTAADVVCPVNISLEVSGCVRAVWWRSRRATTQAASRDSKTCDGETLEDCHHPTAETSADDSTRTKREGEKPDKKAQPPVAGPSLRPWCTGGTAGQWHEELALCLAPWGELEGEHVVLTMPRETLTYVTNVEALLDFWDDVVKCQYALASQPLGGKKERVVSDVQISAGYMHSGYPIMTHLDITKPPTPQNSNAIPTALPHLVDLDTLLSDGSWGLMHEFGHNRQRGMWTFNGTGEVTVNIFTLYAFHQCVGQSPYQTDWFQKHCIKQSMAYLSDVAQTFRSSWCSSPGLALASYAMLAEHFSWEFYKAIFHNYELLDEAERPTTDDRKIVTWILMASRAASHDLRPFFRSWKFPFDYLEPQLKSELAELPPWSPDVVSIFKDLLKAPN